MLAERILKEEGIMRQAIIKLIAFGITTLFLGMNSYANTALSQLNSSDHQLQIAAAKNVAKNVIFTKPGYSFVFGWEGDHLIENTERDKELYGLMGLGGHALDLFIRNYKYYALSFAAPYNDELEPGTYTEARRYPFNKEFEPGLDFSGNGYGCRQLSGQFKVLEIETDSSGNLSKFAADFEHHCEMNSTPTLGSIRFNSSLPTTSAPAILYKESLIIPLLKISSGKDNLPQYRSMVLHRLTPEIYQVDSIVPAENTTEDGIKVPAGYDHELERFVIASVIELSSVEAPKEYEMRFEKLPDELTVGTQLKLNELMQIR